MKNFTTKPTFIIGFLFIAAIAAYFIWWSLPVTINRHTDIKFGNELITKIEAYRKKHGLPRNYDWETLKQLGFKDMGDYFVPEYEKLNDTAFQLVYVEGFDGPYLFWNSTERKWKKDMLTHFSGTNTEDDVLTTVEQTALYKNKAKLIDSVSSGKRQLTTIVTLEDTAKNLYRVQVSEDNGRSLVTYYNFLIDGNNLRILNPNGKIDGQ
jgi:hypothetical protein